MGDETNEHSEDAGSPAKSGAFGGDVLPVGNAAGIRRRAWWSFSIHVFLLPSVR